jgi:hypothetical protein
MRHEHKNIGSRFEDFLKEESLLEEITIASEKKAEAIRLDAETKKTSKEHDKDSDRLKYATIYLDGSVNLSGFKELHPYCQFLLSPYDSSSQRRSDVKWMLAVPSKVQWGDCNMPWKDIYFSWEKHKASEKLREIYSIIGEDPQERRDGLHLDSAYKSGVHVFLTSDKANIWSHRDQLEPLLGFRIFNPDVEISLLKDFINSLLAIS